MRYIKLYEDIDFNDIDDIDIGCDILLFGSGVNNLGYIGVVGNDGYIYVFGYTNAFSNRTIGNYDYSGSILLGRYGFIPTSVDIKNVIPGLLVVGDDISLEELDDNINYYKCDDIDSSFNNILRLLKRYIIK
jgi:hypothetical protein